MEIRMEGAGGTYTLHLEFGEKPTGIGEEVREILKKKYLRETIQAGLMKTGPTRVQVPAPKGETGVTGP